jgi:hypothetical protein
MNRILHNIELQTNQTMLNSNNNNSNKSLPVCRIPGRLLQLTAVRSVRCVRDVVCPVLSGVYSHQYALLSHLARTGSCQTWPAYRYIEWAQQLRHCNVNQLNTCTICIEADQRTTGSRRERKRVIRRELLTNNPRTAWTVACLSVLILY